MSVFPLYKGDMAQQTSHADKRGFHPLTTPFLPSSSSLYSDDTHTDPESVILCSHLLKHTSASLHAHMPFSSDSSSSSNTHTRATMACVANKLAPEAWNTAFFQHTYEGPDDMPGHMKVCVCVCSFIHFYSHSFLLHTHTTRTTHYCRAR